MKTIIEVLDRYTDDESVKKSGLRPVTYIVTINGNKISLTNKEDLIKLIRHDFKNYI